VKEKLVLLLRHAGSLRTHRSPNFAVPKCGILRIISVKIV
ncbi:hypothetical protein GCK32_014860, partial [Trichostrongylus colubriformis]